MRLADGTTATEGHRARMLSAMCGSELVILATRIQQPLPYRGIEDTNCCRWGWEDRFAIFEELDMRLVPRST